MSPVPSAPRLGPLDKVVGDVPVRVLLVEDSDDDAQLLNRALRGRRFDITRAETLEAALQRLAAPCFDVVLLDLSLPDSSGFDTFQRIRRGASHVALIVLTGLDDEELGLKTVQAGAQDYLVKGTLGPTHLVRAIRHACERKRAEEVTWHYANELATRNQQLHEDLQLASEVQRAFLPNRCPTFPFGAPRPRLTFTHRYVPASAVGGDFFDVFALSDTTAAIVMCDVMGHGVRAALVTALLRALIGPQTPEAQHPALMLHLLNQRLRALLTGVDSVLFVSALYLTVDSISGETRLANAGHPKPLRLSASGAVASFSEPDDVVGRPLGLAGDSTYRASSNRLEPKDRLLLFTDGVYEVENAAGEAFGVARLETAARDCHVPSADGFVDHLMQAARAHSPKREFDDDACLLAVDFSAAS